MLRWRRAVGARAGAAACCAALALAGCGEDEKKSGDSAKAKATPTPTPTPEPQSAAIGDEPKINAPVKPRGGAKISLFGRRIADGGQPGKLKVTFRFSPGDRIELWATSKGAPKDARVRIMVPTSGAKSLWSTAELVSDGEVIARSRARMRVKDSGRARIGDVRYFFPAFAPVDAQLEGPRYTLRAPVPEGKNRAIVLYMRAGKPAT
jgi:hypothetical protein